MISMLSRSVLLAAAVLSVLACGGKAPPPDYDVPPVLINRDEITAAMRSVGAGAETRVVLELRIDEDGYVQEARVVQRSGDEELDEAALWIGEQMRFQPAQRAGAAVSALVRVPVTFDVVRHVLQPARLRNSDAILALIVEDYGELEGRAQISVRVGVEGWVQELRDVRGTDDEVREAARKLVDELVFWPAYRGHDRIVTWCNVIFEFAGSDSRVFIERADG